jgi:hypothetical protein
VTKLLASAALALCALVVLAAPALSTGRWRPDPVDFELAPGSHEARAAWAGGVVSSALRAPKRFNLVGMHWRGRSEPRIRVRVRRDGGRWSHWQAIDAHADHNPDPATGERSVAASDPLWVGEADQVQYRMSRRVPGLRLHFVNVQGTATAADRLRTSLRHAANVAVTSVTGVLGTGSARAQDPMPPMVTRAEWGADKCPPRAAPEYGTVQAAYVHHTVSLNDYTPEEAPGIVLAICRYHRNSNGWNDIGYNALVDKYGVLYEGRAGGIDQPVMGAQAQGYNAQSTGIASIGDHRTVGATPEELQALAAFIRWKLEVSGVPTSGTVTLVSAGGDTNRFPSGRRVTVNRVLGHQDTNSTECPGPLLYDQLDELRAMIGSGTPITSFASRLAATLGATSVDYGEDTPVTGRLGSADGSPLASEPVVVQVHTGVRWQTVRSVTTGSDGAFATDFRPRLRMYVRARFLGAGGQRGTISPRLLLHVRPLITLTRPFTRGIAGVRVPVGGLVKPRKRYVYLVLQQERGGRFRNVLVRKVRTKRGRFATSFTPAFVDRYRYYVVAKSDDDNDRGRSERVEVQTRITSGGGAPAAR